MIRDLVALAMIASAPPAGAGAALFMLGAGEAPHVLPVDSAVQVNGLDLACTGVGETKQETRWLSYGERIEFSNARNEYIGGGVVRISDGKGRPLVEASCDAPWILMRLPKGEYRLEGWSSEFPGVVRSARFVAPSQGQIRLVLQFSGP